MAFIFDTDIFVENSNLDVMFFKIKEHLKLAGWTVPRSSDGITYNSSGDEITSSARSVAGGFGNDFAWIVVRSPNGHEWLFARQTGAYDTGVGWRIAVSRSAGFTGGTPDPVTLPTATDQGIMKDGYFQVGPGPTSPPSPGRHVRYNIAAENVAPYRFWAAPLTSESYDNSAGVLAMDTLRPTLNQTLDADPFVFLVDFNPYGYTRAGTANQRFAAMQIFYNGFWPASTISNGSGSNQHNGKDDLVAAVYGSIGDRGQGVKGMSSMLLWTSNFRNAGTVLKNVSAGDLMLLGDGWVAPWNGTMPKRDL